MCQVFFPLNILIIQHLGGNNTPHNYSINNVSLPDITVVTDHGVLVDKNCDLQNIVVQ